LPLMSAFLISLPFALLASNKNRLFPFCYGRYPGVNACTTQTPARIETSSLQNPGTPQSYTAHSKPHEINNKQTDRKDHTRLGAEIWCSSSTSFRQASGDGPGQNVSWGGSDISVIRTFIYTGCFKKSFITFKAYINSFRGHI
jgi:hypothetical protein